MSSRPVRGLLAAARRRAGEARAHVRPCRLDRHGAGHPRELAGDGRVSDGILCYGGLAQFAPGERVDVFAVHEAVVADLRRDNGPFGEIAEVLYGEDKQ